MQNQGSGPCPFAFNFEPADFKAGDWVSYRVPDRFPQFPFVGRLVSVHDDHVILSPEDPTMPERRYRATRESRPVVAASEIG